MGREGVSFEKMAEMKAEAIIFTKLSMALNDMVQCNNYLAKAKKNRDVDIRVGESMYFVRLQLAIMSEALPILKEISNNNMLLGILNRCPDDIKQKYKELIGLTRDTKFANRFTVSRSTLTYHYDETGKLISRAIDFKAKNRNPKVSKYILPKFTFDYFRLCYADEIVDNIMCAKCWGIEIDKNIIEKANDIADECSGICENFVKFGFVYIQFVINELFQA